MSSQTIGFFEACIYLYGGENKFNGYSRSVKQVFEYREIFLHTFFAFFVFLRV